MNIKFEKITFIGLGLIGGSIAKAIREKYPATTIYTHASHIETIQKAYEEGVSNNFEFLSIEELAKSDIIFLCSPVRINIEYLKKIKPYISEDTLITDVGSVKGDIQKAIEEEQLEEHFIGGHPMAGSENTGFDAASSTLIENAYYILTADEKISDETRKSFKTYIQSLGAIPIGLSAKRT